MGWLLYDKHSTTAAAISLSTNSGAAFPPYVAHFPATYFPFPADIARTNGILRGGKRHETWLGIITTLITEITGPRQTFFAGCSGSLAKHAASCQ